jgi:hypothetical protein
MNRNFSGYWNKKKIKIRQRYPIIKDKDLVCLQGKENEMLNLLGSKLGKSNQELLNIIVGI